MIEIKYCENTLGCRMGNEIFIHPELEKHPKLFSAILKHELEHTDGWTVQDVKQDLFGEGLQDVKKEAYSFMLKHPKTLLNYLPLTKIGKYWAFDMIMAGAWALAGVMIALILIFI